MAANTNPEDMVFCPECEGDGEIFEECDCCGHEKEQTCRLCSGDGYLPFGELKNKWQRENCFLSRTYHETVKADLEKLAAWNGKSIKETCAELGYEVGSKGRLIFQKFLL